MNVWRDAAPRPGARWAPSRYSLAGAAIAAVIVIAAAAWAIGFGGSGGRHGHGKYARSGASAGTAVARSGVHSSGAPAAGASPTSGASSNRGSVSVGGRTHHGSATASGAGRSAAAGASHAAPAGKEAATGTGTHAGTAGGRAGLAVEIRDPEEANSHPAPPSLHHRPARAPRAAAEAIVAPGAASDAQIREELAKVRKLESAATQPAQMATVPGGESIATNGGKLPIPQDVPPVIQRVIAGANAIADFPYRYGGGHVSFVDSAYDCSGSVSYALAAGGLLKAPETSGQLESWGAPGPGKWITVYANAGHTYMYVNIGGAWMLYDTAGRSGVLTSRWQPNPVDNEGYVARHWPGL